MDSPELAAYLRASGGLPERDAARRGAPIGPLTPSQGERTSPTTECEA